MKETRMPPAYSANLVANSGNTIYGVSVIGIGIELQFRNWMTPNPGALAVTFFVLVPIGGEIYA